MYPIHLLTALTLECSRLFNYNCKVFILVRAFQCSALRVVNHVSVHGIPPGVFYRYHHKTLQRMISPTRFTLHPLQVYSPKQHALITINTLTAEQSIVLASSFATDWHLISLARAIIMVNISHHTRMNTGPTVRAQKKQKNTSVLILLQMDTSSTS